MSAETPTPKLSDMMLAGPDKAVEPNEIEVAREDQLQAFQDFSNEALPMSERLDSLAYLIDLLGETGPTELDD